MGGDAQEDFRKMTDLTKWLLTIKKNDRLRKKNEC
jgi:hypothetical protein